MFSVVLFLACVAYVTSFWGQAGRLLPAPVDAWSELYYSLLAPWWRAKIGDSMPAGEAIALYRAIEAYVLGLLVPVIGLGIASRRPGDAGLRMPREGTLRVGLAVSLPALPIGILLSAVTENAWGSAVYEFLELAAMVPEHFLIFGVVVGVMLPEHRLAGARSRPGHREIIAVISAGLLFQLAHLGVPTLEAFLALPVGLMFAYTTLYTGSIWPALAIHWGLNLIPLAWLALRGALA